MRDVSVKLDNNKYNIKHGDLFLYESTDSLDATVGQVLAIADMSSGQLVADTADDLWENVTIQYYHKIIAIFGPCSIAEAKNTLPEYFI